MVRRPLTRTRTWYHRRPIWDNFRGLFKSINEEQLAALDIDEFNGGLFASPDHLLDERLIVPDIVCQSFTKLAEYDYRDGGDGSQGRPVDVEILGHIFELDRSATWNGSTTRSTGPNADRGSGEGPKRKKEGAFYTPAFITRYIVAQTLKPVVAERFAAFEGEVPRRSRRPGRRGSSKPTSRRCRPTTGTRPNARAHIRFWQE